MSLIQMARVYHDRPSNLLGIQDNYTSFCLDEACAYIIAMLEDGKKPMFEKKQIVNKQARLPSEIYEQYGVR